MTLALSVVVFSALFATLLIALRLRFIGHGVDVPGSRSLHAAPTPHGGGLPIVLAALAAGAWMGVGAIWLFALVVLAGLSIVDDWRNLPVWLRLPAHFVIAASVVFVTSGSGWMFGLLMTVVIAWAINAYNFMDGADGLAGTMAVIGFGAYAIGFSLHGLVEQAGMCFAVLGAASGFLAFNWHPARIFMGDVGSIPLGFLAGGLGWYGMVANAWPAWFGLLVFSPFLLDATLTLARRALRGERIWEAHREHCYQRMVRMGMSHGRMCARWALVMLVGALLALAVLVAAPAWGWAALVAWWGVLVVLGLRVESRWNQREMLSQ